MHLFGRSPSLSLKALKGNGYPLRKVIGFVWASAEPDIEAAGGYGAVAGYNTIQFAGVGGDYPVIKEIVAMYAKDGKPPPKEMQASVYYNRGVAWAALHIEAMHNAIAAPGGAMPTGEDVKHGFEQIHDFTLDGIVSPVKITAEDHEGGGFVQVWQVEGGKMGMRKTDEWFLCLPRCGAGPRHGGGKQVTVRAPPRSFGFHPRTGAVDRPNQVLSPGAPANARCAQQH